MLAIQKRLKQQGSVSIVPDQVIFHSLANGNNFAAGVGWLASPANPLESHYAVGSDGTIVQLVEETQRAEANYNANRRPDGHGAISIETDSSVAATEPWTDAQVDALVELTIDICRRHGIPARLCPAWDQPGLGWHIMFGAPGKWTPVSKSCPGPKRIQQVREVILPRVAAALRAVENPPPITEKPSTPATPDSTSPEPGDADTSEEDDDMARTIYTAPDGRIFMDSNGNRVEMVGSAAAVLAEYRAGRLKAEYIDLGSNEAFDALYEAAK